MRIPIDKLNQVSTINVEQAMIALVKEMLRRCQLELEDSIQCDLHVWEDVDRRRRDCFRQIVELLSSCPLRITDRRDEK